MSDKRISVCDEELEVDYFKAEVLSAMDYYPFGMMMPDRQWYANSDSSAYSFGFGGQMKDDQISGVGNSYTADYWQYDPRLGRRFNVDPLTKPWEGSYTCFYNNPIVFNDPVGLTGENPQEGQISEDGKSIYGMDAILGVYRWVLIETPETVITADAPKSPVLNKHDEFITASDNTNQILIGIPPLVTGGGESGMTVELAILPIDLGGTMLDYMVNEGDNGKFYSKKFNGNQYVKIDNAGFRQMADVGLAYDVIIVVIDGFDVMEAYANGIQPEINAKVGTLILDATGAVIGYYFPVIGGFVTFYEVIHDDPKFAQMMFDHAVRMKLQILEEYGDDLGNQSFSAQYRSDWIYWEQVKQQYSPNKSKVVPELRRSK